jgi:hypothetical protein
LRLAAVVSAGPAGTEPQLVGDALCVALPDGDVEFALTVAAGWRGWLDAYFLDMLAEVAAGSGMRSLQADILNENRRMLAVVQAPRLRRPRPSRLHRAARHDGLVAGHARLAGRPRQAPGSHRVPRHALDAAAAAGGRRVRGRHLPGAGPAMPPPWPVGHAPWPSAPTRSSSWSPPTTPPPRPSPPPPCRLHLRVPLCVADRPGSESAWPPGAVHVDAASLVEASRSGPLALPSAGRKAHAR